MENILVLAHVEADGALANAALETIAAAKELGGAFCVGLIGVDVAGAANSIAGCGAAKILGVNGAEYSQARYVTDAAAAEAIAKAAGAGIILVAHTSRWGRVVSGVAARLGGRADTHVTGIKADAGKVTVSRWYYRQRMEAQMSRTQRPWVIALDVGCRAPWQGTAGNATVEAVPVTLGAVRTQVTGFVAPEAGKQTIRPDAELLFVAGAGWTKKQPDGQTHLPEAEKLILGFLDVTKASLGSSKSLVDLSGEGQQVLTFMSHMNQIGQTGSTPRHPKGLSTCCHGEEPHAVGWRFVNERRAINLDANCGWARGKADVVYIGDAFQIMAKVNELLAVK